MADLRRCGEHCGGHGLRRSNAPEHSTLADWRAVHAVNLDGTFLGCRDVIGAMRVRGSGSIINISSRSGLVGIPAAAACASSKAAVRSHTKSVAPDLTAAFAPAYSVTILTETAFCPRLLLQRTTS